MLSNFVKLQLSFWIFRLNENSMLRFPLGKSVLFNSFPSELFVVCQDAGGSALVGPNLNLAYPFY